MTRSSHRQPAPEPEVWRALKAEGRLSFGRYMELALYGKGGYYTESVRIGGAGGDFYTAAHIPLFAAILARAAAEAWEAFGRPAAWQVVEWGGGQGEMAEAMASALGSRLPDGVHVRYTLVDVSESLVQRQRLRLEDGQRRVVFDWGQPAEELPTFAFANEVLDALPVERVRRANRNRWEQADVVWDGHGLSLDWRPAHPDVAAFAEAHLPIPVGIEAEVCLALRPFFARVARLGRPLRALFFDYGIRSEEWASGLRPQGTVRAYRAHQVVDPLTDPGRCDITADVHWEAAMASAEAAGLRVVRLQNQGSFLMAAGAVEVLEAQITGPTTGRLEAARWTGQFKQLVLPGGMGERFQVLELEA
ncbi:MAG: SAM-dependent methyltransferase [Alicyclobacillus macrosporangiidus]|uniref:SAM-dependent methyltransferase n=1 Tax=Alicyclobacillus macrosporangiidus TaxID=392015 RepID=UPI0026E9F29D|nr:SAM-dependent methyltransferase [Alicyclobacillus macrosporangiidus]MCL6599074.1 SAM-dependent methyltransferase [Alicyclobacillus macrosporangiidus]